MRCRIRAITVCGSARRSFSTDGLTTSSYGILLQPLFHFRKGDWFFRSALSDDRQIVRIL